MISVSEISTGLRLVNDESGATTDIPFDKATVTDTCKRFSAHNGSGCGLVANGDLTVSALSKAGQELRAISTDDQYFDDMEAARRIVEALDDMKNRGWDETAVRSRLSMDEKLDVAIDHINAVEDAVEGLS